MPGKRLMPYGRVDSRGVSRSPACVLVRTIGRYVSAGQRGSLYNADHATVAIKDLVFGDNEARAGGAIFRVNGSVTTSGCRLSGNTPADVR